MSTIPPSIDDDLMSLVRSADPLAGEDDAVGADGPESLLQQILASTREERGAGHSRRTTIGRVAAVGAVAAVGLGVGVAVIGDGGGQVTPASAAVVRHAIAAVALPSGTILHVDMSATQDNGDGATVSWRDQSWQQNDAPYDRRQLETSQDGTTTESANVGRAEQVYDPATNTIYASPVTDGASSAAQRPYRLSRGPRPGTFILRPTVYTVSANGTVKTVHGSRRGSVVITAAQAKALRDGTDRVKWHHTGGANTLNGMKLEVVPKASSAAAQPSDGADPDSPDFRNQILALLRSGGATLVGHATVDGRDTLEIASADGHTTYYVDPGTYAPVELDTTGTTGGVKLRFETWELLPASDANDALLSLSDQHPGATVDHSQADYVAAEKRLFPNG